MPSWARRRRATSRSATRRSTSRSSAGAIRRLSRGPAAEERHPRGRGDVHAPHGHEPRFQAVRRQARAPGDQLCDRHRPHHQAPGQGQGLSRGELAAAHLARLRQGAASPTPTIPKRPRSCWPRRAIPNGFEFEWTTSQNESWGLPIVEAVIPMLAKVGIKVKLKLVEVTVLTDLPTRANSRPSSCSSLTGPDSLGAMKCFHSKTPRPACNYTASRMRSSTS